MKILPLHFLLPLSLLYSITSCNNPENTSKQQTQDTKKDFDQEKYLVPENVKALINAIEDGDIQLVEQLLAQGVQDPKGLVLKAAIEQGLLCDEDHPNEAQYWYNLAHELIDKNISQDPNGRALGFAILASNEALIEKLRAHGAQDPEGRALAAAIRVLIDTYAPQDPKERPKDPKESTLAAIREKKEALIEELIKYGSKDPEGSALAEAVVYCVYDSKKGNKLIERLINELGSKDPQGSALASAINQHNPELRERFIHELGSKDPQGSALCTAMAKEDKGLVARLIKEIGSKDPEGNALAIAIEKGWDDIRKQLIHEGLSQDPEGKALAAAIKTGNKELVEELEKLKSSTH